MTPGHSWSTLHEEDMMAIFLARGDFVALSYAHILLKHPVSFYKGVLNMRGCYCCGGFLNKKVSLLPDYKMFSNNFFSFFELLSPFLRSFLNFQIIPFLRCWARVCIFLGRHFCTSIRTSKGKELELSPRRRSRMRL